MKLKKILILIMVVVVSIIVFICYTNNNAVYSTSSGDDTIKTTNLVNCSLSFFNKKISNDTSKRDILPGLSGEDILGLRLYDLNGKICSDKNFILNNDQFWDKFISIVHMADYSATFKLILLIDYKKTSFFVDESLQNEFTFNLKPFQVIDIPVQLKNLSSGWHDVLFIIVKQPENGVLKTPEANFLRYTICKDINKTHEYKLTLLDLPQKDIVNPMGDIFLYSADKESYSNKVVKINSSFEYYIGIQSSRNIFKDSQKCALISLLDWSPIGDVKYFTIQKNKEILIKNTLKIENEGQHQQAAIIVLNPYEKYERYTGWVTYSSQLVNINAVKLLFDTNYKKD